MTLTSRFVCSDRALVANMKCKLAKHSFDLFFCLIIGNLMTQTPREPDAGNSAFTFIKEWYWDIFVASYGLFLYVEPIQPDIQNDKDAVVVANADVMGKADKWSKGSASILERTKELEMKCVVVVISIGWGMRKSSPLDCPQDDG